MKEERCVYGNTKQTLDELIRRSGAVIGAYGNNATAMMDVYAHLQELVERFDNLYAALMEEEGVDTATLKRLHSKDEGGYNLVLSVALARDMARSDEDWARKDARLLANALNDINNDIGEDPIVKAAFRKVERLVAERKG